jgi:hypothetical protein
MTCVKRSNPSVVPRRELMALRDEVIPAGDLQARLAALGGWHGDTGGIRKDYRIGYDDWSPAYLKRLIADVSRGPGAY